MTEPKLHNMDGNSFEQWRFRVDQAICDLGRDAYLDGGSPNMVEMFNCNYDPRFAAREWLRKQLT